MSLKKFHYNNTFIMRLLNTKKHKKRRTRVVFIVNDFKAETF